MERKNGASMIVISRDGCYPRMNGTFMYLASDTSALIILSSCFAEGVGNLELIISKLRTLIYVITLPRLIMLERTPATLYMKTSFVSHC